MNNENEAVSSSANTNFIKLKKNTKHIILELSIIGVYGIVLVLRSSPSIINTGDGGSGLLLALIEFALLPIAVIAFVFLLVSLSNRKNIQAMSYKSFFISIKEQLLIILVSLFAIFTAYLILSSILSHNSSQALLNNPDVISLTERIRNEYPECNKIANVSYQYEWGDTSNDVYTFQLDQSGGCKIKVIQFNRNVGYSNWHEETDSNIRFR